MHASKQSFQWVLVSDQLSLISVSLRVTAIATRGLASQTDDSDYYAISNSIAEACEELERIAADVAATEGTDSC